MQREFTGVFIPAQIWEHPELIPAEKMLLGEISALSTRYGYCSAGRKHFANWLHCSVENVSYYFSKLQKMGFITIERETGGTNKIRLVNDRFWQQNQEAESEDPKEGVVNGIYGGSKRDLRGGVNGVYPKYNSKYNSKKDIVDKGETVNGFSVNGKKQTIEGNLEQSLKTEKENIVRGAPAAGADIEKTIEALKENEFVREAFARVSRVPVEKYSEYLEEFKIKCRAEQAKHTNEGDTRKHFLNWARIRYQSESNNQKNTTNANYSKPNRKDPEQARRDAFARTLAILDIKGD